MRPARTIQRLEWSMFWRRQSQEAKLVGTVFGPARARQFEENQRTPGKDALSNITLAAASVAQGFTAGRTEVVARLQRELDALQTAHPADLDVAMMGYAGLRSMMAQGLFLHIGDLAFLTIGELLHARAPLYSWVPVQAWRRELPAKLRPEIRMWAWYHLALCSALTYSSCTNLLQTNPAMAQTLLEPGMSRVLRWLSLSAYQGGWITSIMDAPGGFAAQPEACKLASAGLNILIEHFDGGHAEDFVDDLLGMTRGDSPASQAMGLWVIAVSRGVADDLPDLIQQDTEREPDLQLQVMLTSLLEGSIIAIRSVGADLARADLTSLQRQHVMTDPLTTLLHP
ncbi:hypothetical protein [Deinococcus yunweiensis]|uniref:hypothetical protein n=1 Tax=Deinococcus yunweiensis TaxID=367282 RepID=UPI00398E84DC